jgi:predicted lipoprotein with Yx(FWY)xxD motif
VKEKQKKRIESLRRSASKILIGIPKHRLRGIRMAEKTTLEKVGVTVGTGLGMASNAVEAVKTAFTSVTDVLTKSSTKKAVKGAEKKAVPKKAAKKTPPKKAAKKSAAKKAPKKKSAVKSAVKKSAKKIAPKKIAMKSAKKAARKRR